MILNAKKSLLIVWNWRYQTLEAEDIDDLIRLGARIQNITYFSNKRDQSFADVFKTNTEYMEINMLELPTPKNF